MTAPARSRAAPARSGGRLAPARPATSPSEDGGRHLRVVDARRRRPRRKQQARLRLLAVGACLVVCGSLFGLVGAHALLVSGQSRLDGLQDVVADEQARYQRLRLEVAELESPARVMAAAQERLGMVPPPEITYLSPSGVVAGELALSEPDVAGADETEAPATGSGGSGTPRAWASVKPYLGGRG